MQYLIKLKFYFIKELLRRLITVQMNLYQNIYSRKEKWRPSGHFKLDSSNEYIEYLHFKINSFENILELVSKNCFMASIDLTDVYFVVEIPTCKFLHEVVSILLFTFWFVVSTHHIYKNYETTYVTPEINGS